MTPIALTIAGSDPSGGAGIQADLKTFHQFGVYGEAVVTLLTVQNTVTVRRVEIMPSGLVLDQLEAVLEDIPPAAAKTGALGNADVVSAIASVARRFAFPLVVDPVMISKHGAPLMAAEARAALLSELLPRAFLLTPNIPEAESLAEMPIEGEEGMRRAAERLLALGARNILIKGGHLDGPAYDLLLTPEGFEAFVSDRIDTPHTHGTGCTYSAAITALLAKGVPLVESVRRAKRFVTTAIRDNPGLGHGSGPVNHHASAE
jgi:hydroxymethylpyrimidine/phosphomethylpyrimidine kinase